jgi:hypothetical protein
MTEIYPEKIYRSAKRLAKALADYRAENPSLSQLAKSLDALIADALALEIKNAVPFLDIPGRIMLLEGDLDKYPELRDAYSDFLMYVSGSYNEEIDNLIDDTKREMRN